MPLKELLVDCITKMKGPSWGYELHPKSVELDYEDFLSREWKKASQPEEKKRLNELQKRYAHPDTLPGLLKEHFAAYVKKIYCGVGIDPDFGNINVQDAKDLFGDFAVEYTQPNVDQFLANLAAEFNNIPDPEILNLLKPKLP